MQFVVHSLEQSVGEGTFLNNTGLFVELEGPTDIRRKERRSLVEEFVVGTIFECETYELRYVTNVFLRRIYPDETTRGGIRT